ncbi:hypothetical protein ACLQ2E_29545 [Streptomyces lavendulocolor]|uniref:hypothetical protein n=1 Tax=Streptomyces lavendulocolor TaxID=67316 RepID=UPI0033E5518F
MKRNLRRISALGTAAAALSGLVLIGGTATTAHADMRCDWGTITINGNRGAEAPSRASGHTHRTGNHYVGGVANTGGNLVVDWYADNNGGDDGDTRDSYYGTKVC